MTDKETVGNSMSELEACKEVELKAEQELQKLKKKSAEKLAARDAAAPKNYYENASAEAKLAKRKFAAKDARILADASTKTLSQIYKIIREEAEDGHVRLEWGIMYTSESCVANIVKTLIEDGYTVEKSDDLLIINW